jgi:hypothetical protein
MERTHAVPFAANALTSTSPTPYPAKRLLSAQDINCETRLAVTAHAKGKIGVCFKNHLAHVGRLFRVVFVGLWVEREHNGRDGDCT